MAGLTILDLIKLGQIRTRTEGDVAVTTGGGRLLPFNPMRTKLLVMNHESNDAFVRRRPPAAVNTGRHLGGGGGGFVDLYERSGRLLASEYYAIIETADGNLYVEEEEAFLLPGQTLSVPGGV